LSTTPFTPEYFIEQMCLEGNSPLTWISNAIMFHRSAHILFQLSRTREKQFLTFARSQPLPLPGETVARELKGEVLAAANDMQLWRVSMFLLAIALENLLKARLLENGIELVNSYGKLDKKRFQSHNLNHFARLANLKLCEDDTKILEWLTRWLMWQGRYPVPTEWEQLEKFQSMRVGTLGEQWEKSFALYDHILSIHPSIITQKNTG